MLTVYTTENYITQLINYLADIRMNIEQDIRIQISCICFSTSFYVSLQCYACEISILDIVGQSKSFQQKCLHDPLRIG